jgi:hypothetical protein
MTMIPDQIMETIHFAEVVMAEERKDRVGSSRAVVYPTPFCFFDDQMIQASSSAGHAS